MNSSDSGWDFTMRTNMSNTSLHGGASNSKSNYSLANNNNNTNNNMNNNSSLSLQKFLNNDDVRRKISQSNMMIDYRSGGGEYRNYNNYSQSNGSPSDYYHRSLDTSMHGNNNYSNSKTKSNNYQEKNSSVLGGGLDTSFHGLSLRNPNFMSSPQSSSVFGHGQRNKSSSAKSSSQENVRNFIFFLLSIFFLFLWLILISWNYDYYFFFHSYCLLLLLLYLFSLFYIQLHFDYLFIQVCFRCIQFL